MRLLFLIFFFFTCKLFYAQSDTLKNADDITFILKPKPNIYKSDSDSACSSLYCEKGTASYYGPQFQGRLTSSGERFDMYKFTAAHKTLPLGTYVIVTNLSNMKSVIVKINDRMPLSNKREIDLTQGAAVYLDYIAAGLAKVQIEIFKPK